MTITSQSLVLRRSKSGQYIDLTASPYSIGREFSIPALDESAGIASGSSANVYGGGTLTSLKYNDRAWSFEIRIQSTTDSAVRFAARRVADFFAHIDDRDRPYIEYRVNTDTPEPLWGQYGSVIRFEVIKATTSLNADYSQGVQREKLAWLTINAVIKPYAETRQQLVCTATGGIQEEVIGLTDGRSKGTRVPEGTTNKMTNPCFGHATFGNGWSTLGGVVTASANTDEQYMLPGTDKSARLIARVEDVYLQSINVGNTNKHSISALARLRDGGVISSSVMTMYYGGSEQTATYIHLGNGWYWIQAPNFDGIASAQDAGVDVKAGKEVFLAVVQLEEKAYCTWPCWGDLLGCVWTGTAHASTSTRTAAQASLAIDSSVINAANGSILSIVRFDTANTHPNNMTLVDLRDGSHTTAPVLFFDATTDSIAVSYGGTSVTSGSLSFSAASTYSTYVTWGAGTLSLYINGSLLDSDAYTANALGAQMFIGMNYSGVNQLNGAVISVNTFGAALTAAQVSGDYANLSALISDRQRIGAIPWFWTDDGDGILALDTGKTQLGIVGGVSGNLAAATEIQGALSSDWTTIKGIVLSNFATSIALKNTDLLNDQSGTATAGDYGGQHYNTSVTGAADIIIAGGVSIPGRFNRYFDGVEYYAYMRLLSSSGTAVSLYPYYTGGITSEGSPRNVTLATSYRLMRTNVHTIYTDTGLTAVNPSATTIKAEALLTAGTVTVSVDYIAVFPRPCLVLTSSAAYKNFAFNGQAGYVVEEGTTNTVGVLTKTGDQIELMPQRYNHLQCLPGADETVNPLTTYTVTISSIYVTPRVALI